MESFLEDLKLQVQCSLCNETMVEPKLLQCFHTFCKTCIKTNALLDGQVNIFKCPQCDSLTELKDLNDVEDLEISPIHSRILQVLSFVENQKICSVSASHSDASFQCLDCDRSLCDECRRYHTEFTKDHKVVALAEMTKEDIKAMLNKESPCKTHANQDVEWHCRDCDELICVVCLRDHRHNDHKITSLQGFITANKDALSKNLQEIEKMDTDEKEKKQQEQIALDIKHDGKKAQEQVKKLTQKLVKKIIDHEQKLLNEIQTSITKADRNLRIIRHTPAAQEYIKYFIQNGTASEIIDLRSDTECSKTFTYDAFEKDFGGMKFQPNEQLRKQMDIGVGLLQSFKRADANNSSVEPNSLKVGRTFEAMGKGNSLTVTLRTYKGELCDPPLDDVTVHITPEDDVTIGEKEATADGKIKVIFTPRVPGQLTAEVQVHGNPVSNSPLVMDVKPQEIKEMTKKSKLKNALNTGQTGSKELSGIAVNKTNTKIAVADCGLHCVRVFNMHGDLLLSYGSKGSGREKLQNPQGLSFLDETDLVIADCDNHKIRILNTTSGMLVRSFGCQGNMNGQFNRPRGVHVDDDSNIIVCDHDNHRVQVFTKNGDYLYQFTIPGEHEPYDVVKHNGLFYVSNEESMVHVIEMKDNQSQTTVNTIGGEDYTDGRLHDPTGLAIDNDNNLLVCDFKSKKVLKFALDGRYVGETSELDYNPHYIAVLDDGQIICSSYYTDVVGFFK